MFTGLVEEIGVVAGIRDVNNGKIFSILCSKILEDTKTGDSISLNGACQTVINIDDKSFDVFASDITLGLTNLCSLKQGDRLNLERALTLASRLGGHIVQGHVDFSTEISGIVKKDNGIEFSLNSNDKYKKYIVPQGSITANGISLTVVEMADRDFKLYIIPETIKNTTISEWKVGTSINIEVDIIGKYIENLIFHNNKEENNDSAIYSKLMENGFI